MSSTCFEHSSVHPQEDFCMQFYGISFMHPYKQSSQWKDVLDTIACCCPISTKIGIGWRILITAYSLI